MKDDRHYGPVFWIAAYAPVGIAAASWILWAVAA